jgi:NAD(P)-dependent dehydrogenase (short-subunit alcohol dehydrogenase family)
VGIAPLRLTPELLMSNPIALITGGSRGLGRAAALALADHGMDLIITYRAEQAAADELVAELVARGRSAVALQLDIGDTASLPAFAETVRHTLTERWGRPTFDHLVNNAGHGLYAPFAATQEADFDRLLSVHLKGPFFLTQALLPLLADGGSILNLSSGLTRFALPGYAAYAAAKGAVEVLTRYLAVELGSRGIRVNTLAPGAIETDFGGGAVRDNPALNAMIASQTALGRVGVPSDIGPVIAMLLSPASGWINAQRVEASGGMHV